MKEKIFQILKNQLIVSCQATKKEPLGKPEILLKIAQTCINHGAVAIRTEGLENTRIMTNTLKVPVIGLIKSKFANGYVRITGSMLDVENLLKAGSHIIAIDGTFRLRQKLSGPEFISEIKKKFNCTIMADISTFDEAKECQEMGADCVSTTLSGYTEETSNKSKSAPDWKLLNQCISKLTIPVIAEGRYNNPEYASRAIKSGAWSVVVGSAITRPGLITEWFINSIKNNNHFN